MSKVTEMVKYRLMELSYLENFKDDEGLNLDPSTTSLSLRISKDLLKLIDIIAKKLEMSRSDVVRSFLSASASEAFEELNMSVDEVIGYSEEWDEREIARRIAMEEK